MIAVQVLDLKGRANNVNSLLEFNICGLECKDKIITFQNAALNTYPFTGIIDVLLEDGLKVTAAVHFGCQLRVSQNITDIIKNCCDFSIAADN